MPDVVYAQLRLQFLGRDAMLPSVVASDPEHDPNAFPVESLKEPHHDALTENMTAPGSSGPGGGRAAPWLEDSTSSYSPAFRAIQKQREHGRLVSNLLRLKRNVLCLTLRGWAGLPSARCTSFQVLYN